MANLQSIQFANCNENSAQNFNRITIGGLVTLWFSYSTIVAFRTADTGLVVCENIWSRTTGKHLNWLDPYKEHRLDREEFLRKLDNINLKITLE